MPRFLERKIRRSVLRVAIATACLLVMAFFTIPQLGSTGRPHYSIYKSYRLLASIDEHGAWSFARFEESQPEVIPEPEEGEIMIWVEENLRGREYVRSETLFCHWYIPMVEHGGGGSSAWLWHDADEPAPGLEAATLDNIEHVLIPESLAASGWSGVSIELCEDTEKFTWIGRVARKAHNYHKLIPGTLFFLVCVGVSVLIAEVVVAGLYPTTPAE